MEAVGIMAHFAKIDNGIVVEVLVVSDEQGHRGNEFLNEIGLTGEWIQTSYNGNIRKKYAGIGDNYNRTKDRFEPSLPYPSWKWNEDEYCYEPPFPKPDDKQTPENPNGVSYRWNEDSVSWVAVEAD